MPHSHRQQHLAYTRRSLFSQVSAGLLAAIATGCGYSIRQPYNREIRTVYVPVFRNLTYRRDLNLMLTEAVCKEIEKRTPYKVVGSPEGADSQLSGEVTFADKNLVVENPQNLPRQLSASLVSTVVWKDIRDGDNSKDVGKVTLRENVTFSPEFGDTTLLAYQNACQKMAEQIASMMEQPW
ncbi:MAG: LPS assembly lipoprotein LptE [bacterium]